MALSDEAIAVTDGATTRSVDPLPGHFRTAIIGAGLSGIALGINLRKAGEDDFVIFDKADGVGGTWRANTYPGVECDIHSPLYSYSFAPKKNWSKNFGTQPELLAYTEDCCKRFGLEPHLRLEHELIAASWNASNNLWEIETSKGAYTANILVSAMGYLSYPNRPNIPGLADFSGPSFHTAEWDHDVDLKGKRVAIIGVGATSVQVIPEIQPIVGHLDVYQRSPAWFMPKHAHEMKGFSAWAQQSLPGYHALQRAYHFWAAEMVPYQMARPSRTKFMKDIAQKFLDKSVKDPELRAKLQPGYTIGCKRILFSDTFYESIQKPNVSLVTDGIKKIEENGVLCSDGKKREADVLVLATGFHTNDCQFADLIVGENVQNLGEAWQNGRFAYRGASVPGFPNFFMMLGPNTTVGHTSMTLMIEAHASYVSDAILTFRDKNLATVEIKPEMAERYDNQMQERLAKTVWNAGGCTSYYRSGAGKNATIWPDTSIRFRKQTRSFDLDNYNSSPA